VENWQTEPEPDPEDQYVEEQMKRDIAAFYRAKYPKLSKQALDDLFTEPPF
jgi:hypothetical protein